MTELLDTLINEIQGSMVLPWPVVLARLTGSVVLTGLLGFERERHERPAGLRTHMLVGAAATCYCLITLELISRDYGEDVRMDPIRLVEAVTGGVAFLAAGLIVFARGKIKGLTTGASLWLAASIGLAAGLGLWPLAALVTVLALVIIGLLRIAERSLKLKKD
jgi:putative Mg2+ transporter-C (MgtC) family protein